MSPPSQWFPSRREQALKWWFELLLQYGVGIGGICWEALIDHMRNPTALVVFAGLTGGPGLVTYRAAIKRQIQAEHDAEQQAQPRVKRKRSNTGRRTVQTDQTVEIEPVDSTDLNSDSEEGAGE